MAFNKDELKEIAKLLKEQGKLQEKINSDTGEYFELLRKIGEMQKNIEHVQKQREKLTNRTKELENDLLKGLNDVTKAKGKDKKIQRDKVKAIEKEIGLTKNGLTLLDDELKVLKNINKEWVEQSKKVNKVNLALKSANKILKEIPNKIRKGYTDLKGTGVFDMEKAAREAAFQMGIGSKNASDFRRNIYEAAETTQNIGVGVKELAKMQGSYSQEIGRSVQLSEEGLNAIAELAAGTILGEEGAAGLAAEMEKFNISAINSRDLIEETLNMSDKMGVNTAKVMKSIQNNLKLANKYHFKGGIKGLAKMAATATKFGMSMETTAQFADKLFNIEGAVEMAAKLNTMGGEWAKLGDPMKLMFQARNDMAGLQESIIKATAGMADFNQETGEISFSGLELHRMRELSKITGIASEEIAEMAKRTRKFSEISKNINFNIDDEKMKSFVESTAQFEGGIWQIKIPGEKELKPIKDLSKKDIKQQMDSLKKRAELNQTFDDNLKNTIETLKLLLLPFLEGLNAGLNPIRNLTKTLTDSNTFSDLKEIAKNAGSIVASGIKLMAEFPQIIAGVLGAKLFFDVLKWFGNGVALGQGFNSVAKVGGIGGNSGMFGTKKGGGLKGNFKAAGASKFLKGGAVLGALVSGYSEFSENQESGMGIGENIGRTALTGGGAGLGAWGGASAGAALGALGGPLAPVTVPLGALIGGGIGAWGGGELGGLAGDLTMGETVNDAILSGGEITPINSKDKVFEISKPGGVLDNTLGKNVPKNTPTSTKIHITFDEIRVRTDENVGRIDLTKDSGFIRDLSKAIKEELRKASGGGVLNPNPL